MYLCVVLEPKCIDVMRELQASGMLPQYSRLIVVCSRFFSYSCYSRSHVFFRVRFCWWDYTFARSAMRFYGVSVEVCVSVSVMFMYELTK